MSDCTMQQLTTSFWVGVSRRIYPDLKADPQTLVSQHLEGNMLGEPMGLGAAEWGLILAALSLVSDLAERVISRWEHAESLRVNAAKTDVELRTRALLVLREDIQSAVEELRSVARFSPSETASIQRDIEKRAVEVLLRPGIDLRKGDPSE